MSKIKIIRITTIPLSLKTLLKGQHRFMSANGFDVLGVSSFGAELKDVEEDEGIRVKELEMTRIISPIRDIRSLWNFYKICRQERPQIVHSHTPKAGIIGMLAAKLARVPVRLHTVAGMPLMESVGFRRKILDFVERVTYACATRVYPNSKGLNDFIVQNNYTSKEKLKVIGNGSSNGIDTESFSRENFSENQLEELKASLNICNDDFVFIFVGRLVGDKGVNELVKAFRSLSAVKTKLLLVGSLESNLDPLLPETLQEIEVNSDIISVGFQKDVRPYFAVSNALVFASYREGFPNVVMQAGSMGLPCIVSDINGCNEIIVENVNGTIIPVKDFEAIKMKMRLFLEDKAYYEGLRAHARTMIQSRYEQQRVWDALLEEYLELLKADIAFDNN